MGWLNLLDALRWIAKLRYDSAGEMGSSEEMA